MKTNELPGWLKLKQQAMNPEQLLCSVKTNIVHGKNVVEQISFENLTLNISKNILNKDILKSLKELTLETNLSQRINQLFSSYAINKTERRSANHWLLRGNISDDIETRKRYKEVIQELNKMENIVNKVLSGQWEGYTGEAITDVVNLGVGGSDLGPKMVTYALSDFELKVENPVNIHFVSSIDATELSSLLKQLNPATTLFILSSKSFSTIDTLANGESAKMWLSDQCNDHTLMMKQHFIGISANPGKMTDWGIEQANQLLFWEWVGGRFSLWSTIGLPIALKIGFAEFKQLLKGAHSMDCHFVNSQFEQNLPIILAMTSIWNVNFLNINQHAILPYDGRLKFLPQYLQQLEMESNGKSVSLNNEEISYSTSPIVWGGIGFNAQHAFYQLFYQSNHKVSIDFIASINRYDNLASSNYNDRLKSQHQLSLANCLAQSRALLLGDQAVDDPSYSMELPTYKKCKGGQPSSTLLIDKLTPYSLGQLIALYEHKVFVESVIWNINPFDQWGVELGKLMANETSTWFESNTKDHNIDSSTLDLISTIRKSKINKSKQIK